MHKIVAVDRKEWADLVGELVSKDRALLALHDRHGRTPLALACEATRRELLFDKRYELEAGAFRWDGATTLIAFATDFGAAGDQPRRVLWVAAQSPSCVALGVDAGLPYVYCATITPLAVACSLSCLAGGLPSRLCETPHGSRTRSSTGGSTTSKPISCYQSFGGARPAMGRRSTSMGIRGASTMSGNRNRVKQSTISRRRSRSTTGAQLSKTVSKRRDSRRSSPMRAFDTALLPLPLLCCTPGSPRLMKHFSPRVCTLLSSRVASRGRRGGQNPPQRHGEITPRCRHPALCLRYYSALQSGSASMSAWPRQSLSRPAVCLFLLAPDTCRGFDRPLGIRCESTRLPQPPECALPSTVQQSGSSRCFTITRLYSFPPLAWRRTTGVVLFQLCHVDCLALWTDADPKTGKLTSDDSRARLEECAPLAPPPTTVVLLHNLTAEEPAACVLLSTSQSRVSLSNLSTTPAAPVASGGPMTTRTSASTRFATRRATGRGRWRNFRRKRPSPAPCATLTCTDAPAFRTV